MVYMKPSEPTTLIGGTQIAPNGRVIPHIRFEGIELPVKIVNHNKRLPKSVRGFPAAARDALGRLMYMLPGGLPYVPE